MDVSWNRIHQGDCVAGLGRLPSGSVDLAFADPPFNIGYKYDVYDDRQERDDYLAWSREWMRAVHAALKPDGTFWLAIGDEYAAELKLLAQEIGFHPRSWVVWYYTFGVNCKFKFTRSHAHLFYFVKDPQQFTFRSDALENRIPSARFLVYGDKRANPEGRLPDDTWLLRPQDLADCFTTDEDTWYFPRVSGTFKERAGYHGCQMPEQLLGRIIRACSQPGEIVLDPFAGSASTLITAKKLDRRFVGFELSPEYVERGMARLQSVHIGDPLEGAAEPLMSAPSTHAQRPGLGKRAAMPGEAAAASSRKKSKSPIESIQANAEVVRAETAKRMFQQGLVEAFVAANQGYSLDRVVADPDLNARLVETCRARGLFGDARIWNHALFALRKAGQLHEATVTERTEIPWRDCDPYLFASEIAWKQLSEQGRISLDTILCDPDLAAQFDGIASRWAPGFTPFQYRWAALKLRKEVKKARDRARLLTSGMETFHSQVDRGHADVDSVPERPGVYLLADRDELPLYIGGSFNLRRCFASQARVETSPTWNSVRYFTAEDDIGLLLAYQALAITRHHPPLNVTDLDLGPDVSE